MSLSQPSKSSASPSVPCGVELGDTDPWRNMPWFEPKFMECIEKHSAHLKYSANISWTGTYRYRNCLSYNSTSNALIFRGTSTVFGFSKLPGKLSSIAQVGVSVPVTNQQPVPGLWIQDAGAGAAAAAGASPVTGQGWIGVKNWSGYGSIPIDTFIVGWTSIYQLFWGSLGTRVLTHPQVAMDVQFSHRHLHSHHLHHPLQRVARGVLHAWPERWARNPNSPLTAKNPGGAHQTLGI